MTDTISWRWRRAILQSDLPPTTRHVLLTLSCFMSKSGRDCFPTTRQIAAATGLSERSVCTHVMSATEAGWLAVSVHGLAGQKWKNHGYVAQFPVGEGTETGSAASTEALNHVQQLGTEPRSVASPEGTEPNSARNCEGTEPNDKKALKEVQSNSSNTLLKKECRSEARSDDPLPARKRISYPDAFEAFWSDYPRTVTMSKKEAFDAWKKLDADDRTMCADAVAGFAAYCKNNPDYPPIHACRFISKRRFDSFAPQAPAPAPVISADDWRKRLAYARANKKWFGIWGSLPNSDNCSIPAELIQQADGRNWEVVAA